MNFADAAPCRHRGAPPEALVNQVVRFLTQVVARDSGYLRTHGIQPGEFDLAFPAAVEKIRGSWAASNQDRRAFAHDVLEHLVTVQAIRRFDAPTYGDNTVYRLHLTDGSTVGVIQKGCPDGAHSSTRWERPDWADELYVWWLCSSLRFEPGEHVWKGVARLRQKVSREPANQLDGVIFFNSLCGSLTRPCPRAQRITTAGGRNLPPPCIYVFPTWDRQAKELNWRGDTCRVFPAVLLSAFDIGVAASRDHVGYIGFRNSPRALRTEVSARFGFAKSTSARG